MEVLVAAACGEHVNIRAMEKRAVDRERQHPRSGVPDIGEALAMRFIWRAPAHCKGAFTSSYNGRKQD
jgi:hypothetical protein